LINTLDKSNDYTRAVRGNEFFSRQLDLAFASDVKTNSGDQQSDSGKGEKSSKNHQPIGIPRQRVFWLFPFLYGVIGGGIMFLCGSLIIYRQFQRL
jgi:hypothetical protein